MERSENQLGQKHKVARSAAQTAVLMAILTLVSKLFGFVREMVMAGAYGTSYVTDAYVMAIAIPGMVFLGFYQALDTAYMPLFSHVVEHEGKDAGNRFTSETAEIGMLVAIVAGIVGVLFAEPLTAIFASGFTGEKAALTTWFIRITFSYGIFTSVAGLLETFLRYQGVFLAPIAVGYVQNIILIGIIVISSITNYHLLILGWLFAYIARLIIVWIVAQRHSFHYRFNGRLGNTAKKIMALSMPVFIGSYINQINIFVDKTLASGLAEGSVAALNYGNILVNLFSGLTVSIIISIIYPKMAQAITLDKREHFNKLASGGLNLICIITIPCTLGAMVYSQEIVQVVYERGAFNTASTALTGTAVFFYSIGILFIALNTFFTQIFYSHHDMKTPVRCGAIGAIINIVCNFALIGTFHHGGLALATSIAAGGNAILLYRSLRKHQPEVKVLQSRKKLIGILGAAILAVGWSKIVFEVIKNSTWVPMLILLGVAVLAAASMYLLLLKLLKVEEVNMLKQLIRN